MESERLLHPMTGQKVDTQNEVVEEKDLGWQPAIPRLLENIKLNIFKKHPYKGTTIENGL